MSAREMKEMEREEFIDALCEQDPVFAENYRSMVFNSGARGQMRERLTQWLIQSAQARQRRQGARRAL